MTTLLLVAGESSGDLHGSNLARALKKLDPSIRLIGAGGIRMREAGVEILVDPTAHAAIGPAEAFHSMHRYFSLYRKLQSALKQHRPDAAILIDFPDFNLRFAERVRDHNVPVIYYISPQLWAWRPGRIKTIKKLVTKMLVIFEFEEALYRKAGVPVEFVGHPLLDTLPQRPDRAALRREWRIGPEERLIGLLPGSRKKQFEKLFPRMRKAAELIHRDNPKTRFVVACAPNIDPTWASGPFTAVHNRSLDVMAASDLLITASGTATVEAALMGTPMIVTYVLNTLAVLALRPLVKIKQFAMVNIVAGREIMPEMYQSRAKPELLAREALDILRTDRLKTMRNDLEEVRRRLGPPGASRRAADAVLQTLSR